MNEQVQIRPFIYTADKEAKNKSLTLIGYNYVRIGSSMFNDGAVGSIMFDVY
jgi:hypothetical protein